MVREIGLFSVSYKQVTSFPSLLNRRSFLQYMLLATLSKIKKLNASGVLSVSSVLFCWYIHLFLFHTVFSVPSCFFPVTSGFTWVLQLLSLDLWKYAVGSFTVFLEATEYGNVFSFLLMGFRKRHIITNPFFECIYAIILDTFWSRSRRYPVWGFSSVVVVTWCPKLLFFFLKVQLWRRIWSYMVPDPVKEVDEEGNSKMFL